MYQSSLVISTITRQERGRDVECHGGAACPRRALGRWHPLYSSLLLFLRSVYTYSKSCWQYRFLSLLPEFPFVFFEFYPPNFWTEHLLVPLRGVPARGGDVVDFIQEI